jgi:malate dehydrogenase (quinone)
LEDKITDLAYGKGKFTLFVFIGAGGGSLPLLEKQMFQKEKVLRFRKRTMAQNMYQSDVIAKHQSVYTVKLVWEHRLCRFHIISRMINGEKAVIWSICWFFDPVFKNGSYSDLPLSINQIIFFLMLSAGIKNIPLTKYLIQQVRQSPKTELMRLRNMYRVQ